MNETIFVPKLLVHLYTHFYTNYNIHYGTEVVFWEVYSKGIHTKTVFTKTKKMNETIFVP